MTYRYLFDEMSYTQVMWHDYDKLNMNRFVEVDYHTLSPRLLLLEDNKNKYEQKYFRKSD